jgi:carbon storage regulator
MLVLSRKKDESIVINNDITIVVVEIRGDKVRLGVEAPKEVPVHRREVFEAIARGEHSSDALPAEQASGRKPTQAESGEISSATAGDSSVSRTTAVPGQAADEGRPAVH